MRKLLRSVARHEMEKQGVRHINKREHYGNKKDKSYFADSWRFYLPVEKGGK